jgi:hypothetical protein
MAAATGRPAAAIKIARLVEITRSEDIDHPSLTRTEMTALFDASQKYLTVARGNLDV